LPEPLEELTDAGLMVPFWWGYDAWFQSRGILLYDLHPPPGGSSACRWYPSMESAPSSLPFARCVTEQSTEVTGLRAMARFAYAQDDARRDLVIKIMKKGSTEESVNRYLLVNAHSFSAEKFPCVLPPVAVLHSPHDFSFLVMPRWSSIPALMDNLVTVKQALTFIRCLLTGLAFLHEQRIAHRDINTSNVLINCYSPALEEYDTADIVREHIHTSDEVAYCLFDFDLSVQLPLETDIRSARRPSLEAFRGAPAFHPSDVWCGPPTYNPFAFDVACLGNLLLYHFACLIPIVPSMAPLFARMTTHAVEQRFTALEALGFYRTHLEGLPDEVTRRRVVLKDSFDPLEDPDKYWQLLGPEDEARWHEYRPRHVFSLLVPLSIMDRLTTRHGLGDAPRAVTVTPLPRTTIRPENEGKLTWKPSQKPWVKLLCTVNNEFQEGQIVQIYDAQQIPPSPTDYPNQVKTWTLSDVDSVYRFCKPMKKRSFVTVPSPSTRDVIHHQDLLESPNGAHSLTSYQAGVEHVYYLKNRATIKYGGKELEVRKGTGVTISRATSIQAGPNQVLNSTKIERKYYIVDYYIQEESWEYVKCGQGLTHTHFEQITAPEELKKIRTKSLAAPKVVSAHTLTVGQRRGLDKVLVPAF
ncbi:hypothetical protein OH77DRAFT_1395217, partial [Trametes cingulata]